MANIDLIVDDSGDVSAANSQALTARHLKAPGEGDLVSYLVRNCGHVRMRSMEHDGLSIAFRPGTLSFATISSVVEELLDIDPARIVLNVLGPNAALIHVDDIDDAVAVLTQYSDTALKKPRFFQQPMSVQRLKGDKRLQPIEALFKYWRRSHGNLDIAREAGMRFRGLERRYLARFGPGFPVFAEVGSGYTVVGKMVSEAEGRPVHAQNDPQYGSCVASCLERVCLSQVLQLEMIEADVTDSAGATTRPRYVRLLLPWRSRLGILVSAVAVPRLVMGPCSAT